MACVRHLEFEKFRFFCQICMLGMEICICVPNLIEICMCTNLRLRYGDKAIFKFAAVRHLEFAKIAVLVM